MKCNINLPELKKKFTQPYVVILYIFAFLSMDPFVYVFVPKDNNRTHEIGHKKKTPCAAFESGFMRLRLSVSINRALCSRVRFSIVNIFHADASSLSKTDKEHYIIFT